MSMRSPALRFGLLLMIGCFLLPVRASAAAETLPKPAYRLGVFPYLPALTIDRLYGPLAESLSLELERLVKLRTKSTFENFADAIEKQSYDILFVHPFFFVDAVDHHGYVPLARLDRPLKAVLVAAADGRATALDDLIGGTIGLPPKLAAVSKLIKSALMDKGLRPGLDVGIRHFRNKASCLQAVSAGAVEACGVPAFIFEEIEAFSSRSVRIIFEAAPVSHFAFAVHGRVPAGEREQLRDLVLSLGDGTVDGFGPDKRFVRIKNDDYASIRAKTTHLKTLAQR
ncbi:MAG: phosphate/phosphite/phosphonate ABC transporter substrate-binding protein [Geminicoccaceae bacterium]